MRYRCKDCLYHLPDAEDHVCVCEDSESYNQLTEDMDGCMEFVERGDHTHAECDSLCASEVVR